MHRLRGFDYKRPFFYMVTLKRLPELAAFSRISDEAEPPKGAVSCRGDARGDRQHAHASRLPAWAIHANHPLRQSH